MSERKLQLSLANLERALDRLDEALVVSADAPLAIDATIQPLAGLPVGTYLDWSD